MNNMKRGFKLTSPLKINDAGGDSKKASDASSSTKSYPAQSGGYKVTAKETTIKRSATGAEVKATPKAERYRKARPKGWSDAKLAAHNKKKRAEWDAQDKKAAESKASSKSGSEETKMEVTPELTEAKSGTRSDTFMPEETRMQNRENIIDKRNERKTGKQTLRKNKQAMKNSAEWDTMTRAEKKAAKYELQHGQTSKQKESGQSALSRFGKDLQVSSDKARQMKYGQGELNQMEVKQQIERKGEAETTRGNQYLGNKNPQSTTSTEDYRNAEKQTKGGEKIKADPSENLPSVTPGTSSKSMSESSSSTTTSKLKEEPNKYDYSKNAPFLAAGNQGPTSDPNAAGKMRSSALKFVMKGFGSKAGFNFNKKK